MHFISNACSHTLTLESSSHPSLLSRDAASLETPLIPFESSSKMIISDIENYSFDKLEAFMSKGVGLPDRRNPNFLEMLPHSDPEESAPHHFLTF